MPARVNPSLKNTTPSHHLPPKLKELWLTLLFKEYNPLKERMMSLLPGMTNDGIILVQNARWKLFNRLMDQAGRDLIPYYTRNHHPFCVLATKAETERCKKLEAAFRTEFLDMCFDKIESAGDDGPPIYQAREGLTPELPPSLRHRLFPNPLLHFQGVYGMPTAEHLGFVLGCWKIRLTLIQSHIVKPSATNQSKSSWV